MSHTIPETLETGNTIHKHNLSGSYGNGSNKALLVVTDYKAKRVWYEVQERGESVYQGPEFGDAARIYNKLR